MAGIAHLGVGLAAKKVAPRIPLPVLITAAYGIDIVFGGFWLAGLEHTPQPGVVHTSAYSHGLFMALVYTAAAGLLTKLVTRSTRTGLFMALLFFSHWIVDFICKPMTAIYPGDTGLSLFFEGSPTVGLGLYTTQLGAYAFEFGVLLLGLLLYLQARGVFAGLRARWAGPQPVSPSLPAEQR